MRKPITERATPLELGEVSDDDNAVTPRVRVISSPYGVSFSKKHPSDNSWETGFSLDDEAVVRELHAQLGAWLDEHADDNAE